MNNILKPLSIFFGLFLLWLFLDNILDQFDFFSRFWWYQYHIALKIAKPLLIGVLSYFWDIKIVFASYRDILLPNQNIIIIHNYHLGISPMVFFACFIVALPSKLVHKIWYIAVNACLLFVLNILLQSIVIKQLSQIPLTKSKVYFNEYISIIYIVVIVLWIIFIRFWADKNFIESLESSTNKK